MSETETDVPPMKKQRLDNEADDEDDVKPEVKEEIDFSEDVTETDNKEFSISDSKYCDSLLTSTEEIEKLKEFQVLDDSQEQSYSPDGKSEGITQEEIKKMIDEGLPEVFKGLTKPTEKLYQTHQRTVLEEKGINCVEVLPLDWVMVRHSSGMPIYLHRATRVATLSKPYVLGLENTKRHHIPISSIPCLNYRKGLEKEAKQQKIDRKITEQIKYGTWKNADIKFEDNIDNAAGLKSSFNDSDKVNKADDNIKKTADLESSDKDNKYDNFGKKMKGSDSENVEKESNQQLNEQDVRESKYDFGKPKCPFLHDSKLQMPPSENGEAKSEESVLIPEEDAEGEDFTSRPMVLPRGILLPTVETVISRWKTQHLSPKKFTDYCKSLFKFKTVNIVQLSTLQSVLSEERGLAAALASIQAEWQARAKLREDHFVEEVTEPKEQLRDITFFVEVLNRLEKSGEASREEIAAASVSVPAPPAEIANSIIQLLLLLTPI